MVHIFWQVIGTYIAVMASEVFFIMQLNIDGSHSHKVVYTMPLKVNRVQELTNNTQKEHAPLPCVTQQE